MFSLFCGVFNRAGLFITPGSSFSTVHGLENKDFRSVGIFMLPLWSTPPPFFVVEFFCFITKRNFGEISEISLRQDDVSFHFGEISSKKSAKRNEILLQYMSMLQLRMRVHVGTCTCTCMCTCIYIYMYIT
jgi:hypothetical protein